MTNYTHDFTIKTNALKIYAKLQENTCERVRF